MPRKPLIRSSIFPYHVTARGNNREAFPCGDEVAWRIFIEELLVIQQKFGTKIHAFVMMPNHFHLLTTTPESDLGVIMHRFMSSVTRSINSKTGRCGRIFGSRYHWSLVGDALYYDCVLKYIYRNPVRAKFVSKVEEYRFSSIDGISESGNCVVPANGNTREFLEWLNTPFQSEDEGAIKSGLRKRSFSPPTISWRQVLMDLSHLRFNALSIKKEPDTLK